MNEGELYPWTRLHGVSENDHALGIPSLPSNADTGFGKVRHALGPSGQLRLLVPCGPGTHLQHIEQNGNLSVSLVRYADAGKSTLFVDVCCTNPRLDKVFTELAEGIIRRVIDGHAPLPAVAETINDFRDLLRRPPQIEIPDHTITGLVGELVVLHRLARLSPNAASAWTGPFGQRHDFRSGDHAMEVKATIGTTPSIINIANSAQLDPPSGGRLVLVNVLIERSEHGALTVSKLHQRILKEGVDADALCRALDAIGCTDPNATAWNRLSFSLETISGYAVKDGFPRITPESFPSHRLPDGIVAISYSINLQAAQAYLLHEKELDAAFTRMAA